MPSARYRLDHALSTRPGRATWHAHDVFTGREVLLREGHAPAILHEALVALMLPPGVAARPLAIECDTPGTACVAYAWISGSPLSASERARAPSVELAVAIADRLERLHGLDLVHGDLKPSNIMIERETGRVWLTDLESVRGAGIPLRSDPGPRVGTPPYLAPELAAGRHVDGRADLHALGVLLRERDGHLLGDARWSALLAELTERRAAERPASARVVLERLRESYPAAAVRDVPGRFPAGPLRDRDRDMARLLATVKAAPGARVLVAARPGLGRTRFVLEAAAMLADLGHTVRTLALADLASPGADAWAAAASDAAIALIAQTPESSPAQVEVGAEARRAWQSRPLADRLRLEPLGSDAFAGLVAQAAGEGGARIERLADTLRRACDGNLTMTAAWFDRAWAGEPIAPPSAPTGLPEPPVSMRRPLAVAARLPAASPRLAVRAALERFAHAGACDALVEAGYLVASQDARLEWITRGLRAQAGDWPVDDAPAIDRWLLDHLPTDLRRAHDVLDQADRADRCGEPARARAWLGGALELAIAEQRWLDVLELLANGSASVLDGDLAQVRSIVARMAARLGSEWPSDRIELAACEALKSASPQVAAELCERLVDSRSAVIAARARVLLAEHALRANDDAAFERHRLAIVSSPALRQVLEPGVLELKQAWQAQNHGRIGEANRLASFAVEQLAGSGSAQEALAWQQRGTLRFDEDPQDGIRLMERALACACSNTQAAQIHQNLAWMRERTGDLAGGIGELEAGLERAGHRAPPRLLLGLRERRAWIAMALDRAREARREARALLSHPIIRGDAARTTVLHLLDGYAALHQGARDDALTAARRACEHATRGVPQYVAHAALGWALDVVLDCDAVGEIGDWPAPFGDASGPLGETAVEQRVRAARLGRAGRDTEAAALLERHRERVLPTLDPLAASRWLQQTGRLLRLATPELAATRLAQALALREPGSHAYVRGRLLLDSSRVLAHLGRAVEAETGLQEAMGIARRIGARGLLADCLHERASRRMRMDASAT